MVVNSRRPWVSAAISNNILPQRPLLADMTAKAISMKHSPPCDFRVIGHVKLPAPPAEVSAHLFVPVQHASVAYRLSFPCFNVATYEVNLHGAIAACADSSGEVLPRALPRAMRQLPVSRLDALNAA
jgi:hypothetical protein